MTANEIDLLSYKSKVEALEASNADLSHRLQEQIALHNSSVGQIGILKGSNYELSCELHRVQENNILLEMDLYSCKTNGSELRRKLQYAESRLLMARNEVNQLRQESSSLLKEMQLEEDKFKAESAKMADRLEEKDNEEQCVACLDRPRCVILKPCGHMCLCEECFEKVFTSTRKCPLDNIPIWG